MRRFSFGTFLVDDRNRALYDTCRAVANLSYRGRLPVVLVAPDGFGKTHLLYSIVNRARSGPARTGVAFVSADEFPDEVRRLIRNPDPVERARNAILIVDDLHRFTTHLDALDKLVDLFLKHGHYVVLASSAPVRALNHLPAALQRRLDRGHALQVDARPEADPPAPQPADDAPESFKSDLDDLRRQWQKTQSELEKAQREIGLLREQNDSLKDAAREVGPLRIRIEALQERVERRAPPPSEAPAARQQAGVVLEKAAALLEEVQMSRSKLASIRGPQAGILDLKPVAPAKPTESKPRDGGVPFPALPDEETQALRNALDAAHAEHERLLEDATRLSKEMDGLRGAVARANEERDETRRHLRSAFDKLDRYEKNLEQLRTQLAEYTEEQDRAVESRAQALSEVSRLEASAVAEGLREVQAQFASGLRMIDRMASQLDALCSALDGTAVTALPAAERETFFVTPSEAPSETPPRQPEHEAVSMPEEEPFIPGIGVREPLRRDEAYPAPPVRSTPAAAPRRTLHHVEELGEFGLFSYPEDRDASI